MKTSAKKFLEILKHSKLENCQLTSVSVSILTKIIPQMMNLDSFEFKRMKIDSDFLKFKFFMWRFSSISLSWNLKSSMNLKNHQILKLTFE